MSVEFHPNFGRCRGCGFSYLLNRDGLCEECEYEAMSALEQYYQHYTDQIDDCALDGRREL